MRRVSLIRELVDQAGAGAVADALLRQWLVDPAADARWCRLAVRVSLPARRLSLRQRVALWHLANGHDRVGIAEHMGVSVETVKEHLRVARRRLLLTGRSSCALVAVALRRGVIP